MTSLAPDFGERARSTNVAAFLLPLFVGALLLSAFLLFSVQ